jgi:hypothetical protein
MNAVQQYATDLDLHKNVTLSRLVSFHLLSTVLYASIALIETIGAQVL